MPTVFIVEGFRFFFFSNEGGEPLHIHVELAEKYAKFWLNPIMLAKNYKFNSSDLKRIEEIIGKRKKEIEVKWNEYFNIS
ncbi:hypothetical protein A2291_01550 [candidate division WOR-1 bacterium RIFOXYB2_FULL_42_35]|uniref:DUF4160 domain-containing protein n=1 Tax=candidate division WOR-1 bacterium RIFOXYC2_FULL_41_25 TaxID=1802586 RepID=A0A1F4TQC0_UNCSA|nr:MAG: hypothetical protein A2247_03350 [candidate division WOR-1 bacterium RIFOXYA2_FULL_41_14]OGC25431.1 MAG: hypothetical protein A2291_01550 [candidate division WOR-1 bacterium RIFOXYB2_FULL_42_35]OGC34837.1 MAG: hypothetical protein A2462_05485 [candidate division WOR-1 bacterium RIFOXYC2_FULL_41_25]OGC42670.1 MAG: hypothetical protein A2548_07720 [candidate division WOR-1 bacterium RIFOXYD2_FULL_41_8]